MSLCNAKKEFETLIANLKGNQQIELLKWIAKNWKIQDLPDEKDIAITVLEDIAAELRKLVPLSGVLPSERLYESPFEKKSQRDITIHLDEFLYPDDLLDDMEDQGKISRYYCKDCGSNRVDRLKILTHSLSIEGMKFVFTRLLPPLTGKVFLDVGSRLGSVLYGAFLLTPATKIIGVEINGDWCKHAQEIINKRNMQERIDVVHSDLRQQSEHMESADVILVSNVFEYFSNKNDAEDCWQFMINHIKPDATLVLCPKAEKMFKLYDMEFADVILVNNVFEYFTNKNDAEDCWQFMIKHIKPDATLVLSPKAEEMFKLYDIRCQWTDWLIELPLHDGDINEAFEEFYENMAAYRVKKL